MIPSGLRFAPLIRVSTEQQEKQGESLRTQKIQIEDTVDRLGGTVPEVCWDYCGQEHATPGQERKKLERLLSDASKNIYDAVIVCDPSRWSRDNIKSEQGLEVLLANDIKFFAGSTEYDLRDPQARMFLAMSAVMNQFQARSQAKKSLENRVNRAKRNIPSAGRLPYGRTFDRKTNTWGIDEAKKEKIEWIADLYIKGEKSIFQLAKLSGINEQFLWSVLKFKCGDTWTITFDDPRFNIHEIVTLNIPRLLPEETIKKIHDRLAANKTFSHGPLKYKYLLSRMIFCEECGTAMTAESHPNRSYQIYRHQSVRTIKRACPNRKGWYVRREEIEEAVIARLFALFGDPSSVEEAIQKAIPDLSEIEELRSRKADYEKKLQKLSKGTDRLLEAIQEGIIPKAKAKEKMDDILAQENILKTEISKIEVRTENAPTKKQIQQHAALIKGMAKWVYSREDHLETMSWEKKRNLCEKIFAGKDAQGRRLGVYIKKEGRTERSYIIRGILGLELIGYLADSDINSRSSSYSRGPGPPVFRSPAGSHRLRG